MSSLTPLAFPEDNKVSSRKKSTFPYTAVSSGQHAASAQSEGNNRMQQLEAMLKEAQGRAEVIEKETYEKAYMAGEKAGMALGRKRGEQILESLQETLKGAESSLSSMQHSFAEAAIDVAGHIAERIVGTNMMDNAPAL
ncbi:MAG: flagellar assembly protein, partial [Mariprofundus sp.]